MEKANEPGMDMNGGSLIFLVPDQSIPDVTFWGTFRSLGLLMLMQNFHNARLLEKSGKPVFEWLINEMFCWYKCLLHVVCDLAAGFK